MTVTIAIVTDIHHGRDSFSKKSGHALPLLAEFVRFVGETGPDLVIDLGDRISDENEAEDLKLEREVAALFAKIEAPVHHICGNHDCDFLSVAQNEAILGQSLTNRTLDVGDWTIVLWRADAKMYRPVGFALPETDLLWLTQVVREARRPLAIFSHVPISGHDVSGNYWFSRNAETSTYPNVERIRALLATAKVPVATFAGHVHWNSYNCIDGIAHFTLQSLTESFTTAPEPAGCWSLLRLDDNIALEVLGLDRMAVTIPAAQTARRWLPPLPPFSENPEILAHKAMPHNSS